MRSRTKEPKIPYKVVNGGHVIIRSSTFGITAKRRSTVTEVEEYEPGQQSDWSLNR